MESQNLQEPEVAYRTAVRSTETMSDEQFYTLAKEYRYKSINPVKHRQDIEEAIEADIKPKLRNLLYSNPGISFKECLLTILTGLPDDMFPADYLAFIEVAHKHFISVDQ